MSPRPDARVWLAFLGVVAAWGSSYLFIRLAVGSFTAFGLVATRFGAAALICAAIGLLRKETFPRGRELPRLALLGVMMMSGSNALTAFAQRSVASGIAGVVHSLSSVWLPAIGSLPPFKGEKISASVWLGVFGGVAGVAFLLWPSGTTRFEPLAAGALVLASVIFTVASLLQRRWREQDGGAGLFSSLAVQMGAGAALSTLLAVATTGFTFAPIGASAAAGVLWLTLISSIGGFAAYSVVLRSWPPARTGSFAVVNPVVSVLLGVTFLDEPFTARMAVGAGVTIAAVAWVQLRPTAA